MKEGRKTDRFNAFAVHFVMPVYSSKVESSITFLTDQKIRKVDLNVDEIPSQNLIHLISENYFFEFQFDGVKKVA